MKKSRGKKMVAVAIVFIIIAAILLYLSVELIYNFLYMCSFTSFI